MNSYAIIDYNLEFLLCN